MANWDFCSDCNRGRHCRRHDGDGSYNEKPLHERFTAEVLMKAAAKAKKEEQKRKDNLKQEIHKEISKLKEKILELKKELGD